MIHRLTPPARPMVIVWLMATSLVLAGPIGNRAAASGESPVDFARDVRPILSDACYSCHGPDEENRQAGLRLDSFDEATADLGGYSAFTPGDVEGSEAWIRMHSDDADLHMPPPESGKRLSDEDKEVLRRWIEQGAEFADHWAFIAPVQPEVPTLDHIPDAVFEDWRDHPIDRFVGRRLIEEGLTPQDDADRLTLLRRLSLDLIGLPPTPDQIDAFVSDQSPDAYEKLVDRLLANRHFGEHWGRLWLDNARYADSDGFEKDKPRSVWFYRDWVARAFADDMPYDQFIIKQIAGDLLPGATQDDLVATGFLRNSMHNEEGGIDPEQFRMEAMYDRMDAVGKSVLGLTLQCAQCHSHKYDPISHTEYYQLFAMLNNFHESSITVFTAEENERRGEAERQIDIAHRTLRQSDLAIEPEFAEFVSRQSEHSPADFKTLSFDWIEETINGQKYIPQSDGSYLQQGYAASKSASQGDAVIDLDQVRTVRLELMRDPNLPHGGPGRSFDGTWAISELKFYADRGDGEFKIVPWKSAAASVDPPRRRLDKRYWFKEPDPDRVTGPVDYAIDNDEKTAWTGTLSAGRRNDPQVAYFEFAEPIRPTGDGPIKMRIELVMKHGGWNSDDNQSHNVGRFRVGVSGQVGIDDPSLDTLPPRLRAELNRAKQAVAQNNKTNLADQLSAATQRDLFDVFLRRRGDAIATDVLAKTDAIWDGYPTGRAQLVVQEREVPRKTHRLDRGDFLSPREEVSGWTPSFLHELPDDATGNRLDLAHWLVDRRSPTTARAIVNRIWQAYFGTGLTATTDDLGLQGEPPTHVELLDHLAVQLMENDWSLKSLHRDIVTSRVYRQSSRVTDEVLEVDPGNRLLARGSRFRVPAETVRDIALTASGLLDPTVGGEPVYPKAPDFLFVPPASYGPKVWGTDATTTADNYRRGFYTFRFRSAPYPAYQAFDAPTGEVSCVTRSRSNTPLQALVTLNEPLFLQCAVNLADEVISANDNEDARYDAIVRRCLGRDPTDAERRILAQVLRLQQQRMQSEPSVAEQLMTHAPMPSDASPAAASLADRAAWTMVARVVLNLDETITRE